MAGHPLLRELGWFSMKFPWGIAPLLSAVSLAHAAAVDVRVTDTAGNDLAGAVVALEPTGARLPVAPMSGIEISQTKRQFNPQVSVVTVGTPVLFPNLDTVRHHVYSFSPTKNFELKLYAGVPAAPVVFDKPGIAVIGCNIHDKMVAWVVVVDTPLYARSATNGRAHISGVPAGNYLARVWHSGLREGAEAVVVPISVGNRDVNQGVQLNVAGTTS